MKIVAGIRFKKPGKVYYFDPQDFKLERGMHVIVDTAMGEEYGEVVFSNKEVKDEEIELTRDAIESCPTGAIALEEKKEEKNA